MSVSALDREAERWVAAPWDPAVFAPIDGAADVRVLVLAGYGLNCEAETEAGFAMAGATVEVVHVADVMRGDDDVLARSHIVVFGGGFSFGDHIASGRVFANRVRARLGDALARHVDDGGLVLGICNGFQTIVKLGLVPALERVAGQPLAEQSASLVSNDRPGYWDCWVSLVPDLQSPSVFLRGATGAVLPVPSRHGEGKLVFAPQVRTAAEAAHCIPLRYADDDGQPAEAWPANPNGSRGGAAALCDTTGRVLGLMPHPEAYLYPDNHPRWIAQRDRDRLPPIGWGAGILFNGVRAAAGAGLAPRGPL